MINANDTLIRHGIWKSIQVNLEWSNNIIQMIMHNVFAVKLLLNLFHLHQCN